MKINYSDPLQQSFIEKLISAKQENQIVDYKTAFVDDTKHWCDIAKDCISFANNKGGYLIFGVNDDFSLNGLSEEEAVFLTNTNNIQMKVCSHSDVDIEIKTCNLIIEPHSIVTWFISPSDDLIVCNKDGKFKYPSGSEGFSYRKGQVWTRKNSGNQLMTSRQLSGYLEKKIQLAFKELLSSFSAVAKNPKEFVMSRRKDANPMRLSNDPSSTPMHGISFSITPKTLEEKVFASVSVYNMNYKNRIDAGLLCEARIAKISNDEIDQVLAQNCLLNKIPTLYWFVKLSKEKRVECILNVVEQKPGLEEQFHIAKMSMICGSVIFKKVVSRLHAIFGREIDLTYNRDRRSMWQYTTDLQSIKKSPRDLIARHQELLLLLKDKYSDTAYHKEMLYIEYTMYFLKSP